ncbi:MAG: hypothetical protein IPK63_16465, partial [Candidatus Competibacteraceae bacterium]|nr:hypothetical protein [Candidatus Competibacteraceae bacterium]
MRSTTYPPAGWRIVERARGWADYVIFAILAAVFGRAGEISPESQLEASVAGESECKHPQPLGNRTAGGAVCNRICLAVGERRGAVLTHWASVPRVESGGRHQRAQS